MTEGNKWRRTFAKFAAFKPEWWCAFAALEHKRLDRIYARVACGAERSARSLRQQQQAHFFAHIHAAKGVVIR